MTFCTIDSLYFNAVVFLVQFFLLCVWIDFTTTHRLWGQNVCDGSVYATDLICYMFALTIVHQFLFPPFLQSHPCMGISVLGLCVNQILAKDSLSCFLYGEHVAFARVDVCACVSAHIQFHYK